ncbi:putative reverse transcriptase domain-containing protein [Tanacetum coccineum]
MAPKRTTRSTPVTSAPIATTTTITKAQLQALIEQGITAAMAEAEATRVRNGYATNGTGLRPAQAVRECSYSEFLKCKPLDFKGTEGVTITPEAAHVMPWATLKKMMTDKYCPRGEIKKIETEMWNLNKIEKYIGGLSDMILGSVKAIKAITMQRLSRLHEGVCGLVMPCEGETQTTSLQISTLSERQAENKRKLNNTSKNNQNQQQPNKRQNTGKAYAAGHGEKKYYGGSKPLCPKCNYHHDGPCPPKCHRCNIVGHLVRNCRRPTNDNTTNNQRGTGTSQKVNCYECGNQGHYKRDCPERKNQSHKNQIGGTRAHGVVHTLRGEETDQDPNNIKDEIKA